MSVVCSALALFTQKQLFGCADSEHPRSAFLSTFSATPLAYLTRKTSSKHRQHTDQRITLFLIIAFSLFLHALGNIWPFCYPVWAEKHAPLLQLLPLSLSIYKCQLSGVLLGLPDSPFLAQSLLQGLATVSWFSTLSIKHFPKRSSTFPNDGPTCLKLFALWDVSLTLFSFLSVSSPTSILASWKKHTYW